MPGVHPNSCPHKSRTDFFRECALASRDLTKKERVIMPTNTYGTTTTHLTQDKKSHLPKLHLTKGDLFHGVQTVQAAISLRGTLPVLGNILFEASDQGLRLSATDLEVGIRSWVKADVLSKGAITIPAKILS